MEFVVAETLKVNAKSTTHDLPYAPSVRLYVYGFNEQHWIYHIY